MTEETAKDIEFIENVISYYGLQGDSGIDFSFPKFALALKKEFEELTSYWMIHWVYFFNSTSLSISIQSNKLAHMRLNRLIYQY